MKKINKLGIHPQIHTFRNVMIKYKNMTFQID